MFTVEVAVAVTLEDHFFAIEKVSTFHSIKKTESTKNTPKLGEDIKLFERVDEFRWSPNDTHHV